MAPKSALFLEKFAPPSSGAGSLPRVVFTGLLSALVFTSSAPVACAGDILRGGVAAMPQGASASVRGTLNSANASKAAKARANANDALARTTQALQSVRDMQAAARQIAKQRGNSLSADRLHALPKLPTVKNGLNAGGLVPDSGLKSSGVANSVTTWTNALTPVQKEVNGRTIVNIEQTGQQAILNWETFNIGAKTTLNIDQSAGGSETGKWIAFNKINDPAGLPSQILGSLHADGQVYVINQNGIIFGGGSQVNTHALVASSLRINENLIASGILNNTSAEFLFSGLPAPTSDPSFTVSDASPSYVIQQELADRTKPVLRTSSAKLKESTDYTLSLDGNGKTVVTFTAAGLAKVGSSSVTASYRTEAAEKSGDVIVQAGALIKAPTTSDHVGGRVALVGANVRNEGTISTPDGQTILAAGLEVGFDAHKSSDPTLRGLDAYVGAVADPYSTEAPYAGTATNTGLIESPRGSVVMTGKSVNQGGGIESTTSVSLNGRIDLRANYDAVSNPAYNPTSSDQASPFYYQSTGVVTLGAGSVTRILPEWSSLETVTGSKLALNSQVNVDGYVIHLAEGALLYAPSADATLRAGRWVYVPSASTPKSSFVFDGGQIYFDRNSLLNVAGSTDVQGSVTQNILSLQLLGDELADSPLQRFGSLRGATIQVDIRESGIYNGLGWVGTPLADASGYVGLIKRTVSQLTTDGGTVSVSAGESVVMQPGSQVDVSGGWTNYEGATVKTTRLLSNGRIVDIANATPDQIYDGIYTGEFSVNHPKWGLSETYTAAFLSDAHYEAGYVYGADGGSIDITAPSMALDGRLVGQTVAGERQREVQPGASRLSLSFHAQDASTASYVQNSPTPPKVVFAAERQSAIANAFSLDANGNPSALPGARLSTVFLSPELFGENGFGVLELENSDGDILVPENITLSGAAGGTLSLTGANITIAGDITVPGGTLNFTAPNLSLAAKNALLSADGTVVPEPEKGRGVFTLRSTAVLSTAGLVLDNRDVNSLGVPAVTNGGRINIASYSARLQTGSTLDVSGGVSVSPAGKVSYADAGSISIKAGQDTTLGAVLGGKLLLGSELKGYSGATGGSFSLVAPMIQIGGATANAQTLLLSPEFFNQGGFSSFALHGLGAATDEAGEYLPGVRIASGTRIEPQVESWIADLNGGGGLSLETVLKPESLRSPVSLVFDAPGVTNASNGLLVRGDVKLGLGALIDVGPKGSVTLSGNTASVLGSVEAPGGKITISGGKNSSALFTNTQEALATVYIGPDAVLSAAGETVLTPNAYGQRTGSVLPGGSIAVSGNILAARGAVLDVSGASDWLDVAPAYAGLSVGTGFVNGVTSVPYKALSVPFRLDSNGGSITLSGGQALLSSATLLGAAGGPGAQGGSLTVSSGRFRAPDAAGVATGLEVTLQVAQDHQDLPSAFTGAGQSGAGLSFKDKNGDAIAGLGYFAANDFANGGFDALTLKGVVDFTGRVNISAGTSISVADGGLLYGNDAIRLAAPHVTLGTAFQGPIPAEQQTPVFQMNGAILPVFPTYGPGSLTVKADLVDIGNLSLQNIGKLRLIADDGDIRGDGTLDVAGDIFLRAGQVYPPTGVSFTIAAHDYVAGGETHDGSVSIAASGDRQLPLSAGGTLNIYGSTIKQAGVLRAPFGSINIGWDGTGTAPVGALTGASVGITKNLTLAPGSITSVSAVDPRTGEGILIPYGLNLNGTAWMDPAGEDITTSGVPEKNVRIGAQNADVKQGAVIDIRGGGDLYAYRWVEGSGGSRDILASTSSFAVIPGYEAGYAPYAPFNTASSNIGSDTGYTNSGLKAGDKIYLQAGGGPPAGVYTLLPARYALLPGAFLVSPKSGAPVGSAQLADGAALVSGYRYNDLGGSRTPALVSASFEIASADVIRNRAQYNDSFANSFFGASGRTILRLPEDAGHVVFQASDALALTGRVLAGAPQGNRGGLVDISSASDIVIGNFGHTKAPGELFLDASQLSAFGAESLLIGGVRQDGDGGTTVSVNTGSITVDNSGSVLSAPEVVLVANESVTVAPGAEIRSSRALDSDRLILGDENVTGSGDGALVRVSGDKDASILRLGLQGGTVPSLVVGADARLTGASITLDSTYATSLDPAAILTGHSIALNSGQISVKLDSPGALQPTVGLVLSGEALGSLQSSAKSLSLLSYSSIDFYGAGTLSTEGELALHAAVIRGLNNQGGTVSVSADRILLEGVSGGTAPDVISGAEGTIALQANTIQLGEGQLAFDQFENVTLAASGGILANGAGQLTAEENLSLQSPVLTAASKSVYSVSAGGKLELGTLSGQRQVSSGLGASLTLSGASVSAQSLVQLPAGLLTLHATTGDLVVGGELNVSGVAESFYDVAKYSGGGNVQLLADAGSINISAEGRIDVSAPEGGGNAGSVSVKASQGSFTVDGALAGNAGAGGRYASFSLDVGSLPSIAGLSTVLNAASFDESREIRIRTGDVTLDGLATAHRFSLFADQGSIDVIGTVNAAGATGGSIHLAANGDVVLEGGSVLTVAGEDFNTAGKGGEITLEAGAERNGIAGTGVVDIQTGSTLNLSVAAKVAGNATTPGSSAYAGEFSGKLHIRAPQNASHTDLLVNPINGTIVDASSILVEGYRIYDLTASGGTITSTIQNNIKSNAQSFLGTAGSTTAGYTAIKNRLLANNPDLESALVLAPGAEVINRTGNLTLGAANSTTTSDWNLSTFRFGAKSAPGVLTLRAYGDLVFYNSLSDGFSPTLANTNADWLRLARLSNQNASLPVNTQSWSYRLTAGADLTSANSGAVVAEPGLAGSGNFKLGKNNGTNASNGNGTNNSPGNNATTSLATSNRYQTVRTGSGDIEIHTAGNVQLLNQFATIYSAGTRVTNPTLDSTFDVPVISQTGGESVLGANQQPSPYAALYSMAGGNVSIFAQGSIEHLTRNSAGELVADSERELPNNWLYRRGYVDPSTGLFGAGRFQDLTSTTWWVDFSNFFEGVGALGGGNVSLAAGGNVSNVDAVIPTNARMAGKDLTGNAIAPDEQNLVELGGGNLTVRAGSNIDGGVYYAERGRGVLEAGGAITTNATRSPSTGSLTSANTITNSLNWLPTTLFLGKGGFDVSARGDVLLGPVSNPFLLPAGINNTFWYKSYFSTYAPESYVQVSSLGGDVTLREASRSSVGLKPLLQSWAEQVQLLNNQSVAYYQPWLRLAENSVQPFSAVVSLQPGTVKVTAFSGDINVTGALTLAPASEGTVELLASGAINGLQRDGSLTLTTGVFKTWDTAAINLSDADPNSLPGITAPLGYQTADVAPASAAKTLATSLDNVNKHFGESGGLFGEDAAFQTKLARHAQGLLHAGDSTPLRLYATTGDISGVTLFSPKATRVLAGRDITDIALYLQNTGEQDVSVVGSGRDLVAYDAASLLRIASQAGGNLVGDGSAALAGDIQVSGPGTLEVFAGRNLDLGTGGNNADGTGAGITSIGNARNPFLPFEGADILVGAGIGLATNLSSSRLDFDGFIDQFLSEGSLYSAKYLPELATVMGVNGDAWKAFGEVPEEQRDQVAMEIFYRILRDSGRDQAVGSAGYVTGFAAIDALFPAAQKWAGNILTQSRDIRTKNGGAISIFAPGGGLTLGSTNIGEPLTPPGVITESGGAISVFTDQSVDLGISRIFTLRGGDIVVWSSNGDVAAGSSPKTVASAPPVRVLIDPQSGNVQTDLAGLATGGGIGVLATVEGVPPGDVDLIAPSGVVDAGDAGIRVSGKLSIAATQVLNTSNIQAGQGSMGVPTVPAAAAPNIGSLTSAANATAAATNAAQSQVSQNASQTLSQPEEVPSIITVEVLGYGGGDEEEDAG